jgi:hypothetical protein
MMIFLLAVYLFLVRIHDVLVVNVLPPPICSLVRNSIGCGLPRKTRGAVTAAISNMSTKSLLKLSFTSQNAKYRFEC